MSPKVDMTHWPLVNPPFLFGAITPQLQSLISKPDHGAISTDAILYALLFPTGTYGTSFLYGDVQDIAKLHVKAISPSAKFTKDVGRKRLVVASPGVIDWNAAVQTIAKERPELKDRLIDGTADSPHPFPNFDFERVEQVLGVKKEEFVPFNKVGGCSKSHGY